MDRAELKEQNEPADALVEFQMDGEQYAFVMPALSIEDAERRLQAIRMTGQIAGWPCYTYKPNALTLPFIAAWVSFSCFFRNLFQRSR